jgi:hypothetical protein
MYIRFKTIVAYLAVISLLTYPPLASAYIGPGLGSGAVVAVLGTVLGFLMLVVGVIWYPIKKLIRRLRAKK